MPSIDMPLEQMRQYKPALYREADFEQYWETTLAEAIEQPINAELIPYDLPLAGLQAYAVRFDGFLGGRLAGWYLRPTARGKFPGVCMYHGYSGRGARLLEMAPFAAQGMCVLSMDCRGQNGQSQDMSPDEGHAMGWMTKGIRNPREYYYRYIYADAIRALELLAARDEVDEKRLAITGGSQGGGITLAVAALSERPALALPDIPFLCDFRRAMQIAPAGPYPEIASFLRAHPSMYDITMRTLSYCDCMNLAPWIKCRTVVSNSLWDDVCPPSTIFAAYNHITASAEKRIEIYPFHKHELPYEHYELKHRVIVEAFLK
jgi:cephalosporin-C deacetylase